MTTAAPKMTSYYVEFAKSGRSKCKKCKEPIIKDDIRIIVEVEGVSDYTMSSNFHLPCFALPKPYKDQSVTYFVQNILHDKSIQDGTAAATTTDGKKKKTVLPDHENEIIAAIEMASSSSKKRKSGATNDDNVTNPITELKRVYLERSAVVTTETKSSMDPSNNKKKKSRGKANAKSENVENIENYRHDDDVKIIDVVSSSSTTITKTTTPSTLDMVDYYGMYYKYTIDALKDILRYNRQNMTGTKDILLYKVVDGCYYNGRITYCPLCTTGKLKLVFTPQNSNNNYIATVQCNGTFDEMIQRRMDCNYTCTPANAVRQTPFYTDTLPPTETDMEQMDQYDEAIKNGTTSGGGTASGNDVMMKDEKTRIKEQWIDNAMVQLENGTLSWNLSSRDKIRDATRGLVEILLLSKHDDDDDDDDMKVSSSSSNNIIKKEITSLSDVRLDIPTDINEAIQKVGPVIATNKDKSLVETIDILIQQFGWYSDKVQKQNMKQNTVAQIVHHPSNTLVVLALQELSDLYFKTGNTNAGISYKKVASAIQTLPYEITSENAKKLGSGKNKVNNIGKSSADKIYEFVTTGTMQKLMEKRAEAA